MTGNPSVGRLRPRILIFGFRTFPHQTYQSKPLFYVVITTGKRHSKGLSVEHDNITDIYTYMRQFSNLLGERILQEFPALHRFEDPVSPRIDRLLRTPFPAQKIAIMGTAKRWQQARTALIVAECGTGKTLISLGAVQVHAEGKPCTSLAMVPPHLVEKWAREAFLTVPGIRVFLIDDLRNGGDEKAPHGVNEVRLKHGRIVRDGLALGPSAKFRWPALPCHQQ